MRGRRTIAGLTLLAASRAIAAPDNSPDAAERNALLGIEGFAFSGVANADLFGNLTGGLDTGVRVPVKLSGAVAYDGGNGWSGLFSAQYVDGQKLSGDLVGDVQTVSNIEADKGLRIYEVWVQRQWHDVSLKFGLTDLNGDFDQQEAGALFLNSSDGIAPEFSQSGRNGPSIFPTTALAATLSVQPADGWDLKLGVFDGTAGSPDHPHRFAIHLSAEDGALVVAQATRRWGQRLRVAGGVWGYTARFPLIADPGRQRRDSRGIYGIVEGVLFERVDGRRQLTGWVRAGLADDRVNPLGNYVGGGVTFASPFGSRDGDDAGLSVMRAGYGGPARRLGNLHAAETTIEATYHLSLSHGLSLQPDLQYVIHPSGDRGLHDALVAGLRLSYAVARSH